MEVVRLLCTTICLLLVCSRMACGYSSNSQPPCSVDSWAWSSSIGEIGTDPVSTSTVQLLDGEQVDQLSEANRTSSLSEPSDSPQGPHYATINHEPEGMNLSMGSTESPVDVTDILPRIDSAHLSSLPMEPSPDHRDAMSLSSQGTSGHHHRPDAQSAFNQPPMLSTAAPFSSDTFAQFSPDSTSHSSSQPESEASLFYQTTDGQVFGPFSESQVLEWCYEGYFTAELLVTTDPRQFPFIPLGEWLNHRPYSPSLHDTEQQYSPQYTPQYTTQYPSHDQQQHQHQYQYQHQYQHQHQQHLYPPRSQSWSQPTASISTWLTNKVSKGLDQLQQHTPVVDKTQLSHLWQASSQNVKKAMSWQTMKRTASKLGLAQLKTVLPKRSRYQDATLDAMWSKKNRQLKTWSESLLAKMPTLPLAATEHRDEDDDAASMAAAAAATTAVDDASASAAGLLSLAATEGEGGVSFGEGAMADVPLDGVKAMITSDAATGTSNEEAEFASDATYHPSVSPAFISSAVQWDVQSSSSGPPQMTRRRRSSLLSALRALPASVASVFTAADRRSASRGSEDVLHLWDESERDEQKQRHSSGVTGPSTTVSHGPAVGRQGLLRGLSTVVGTAMLLLQLVAWAVLLQRVITDVDWAVWMPRIEDVLQRVVVVDFFDTALYRHIGRTALQSLSTLLQMLTSTTPLTLATTLYGLGQLWTEHVRSWLVHADNAAAATVLASSLLLGGLARSEWLSTTLVAAMQTVWMAVFALCVLMLRTKVLASLEITAGAAAVSVTSSIAAPTVGSLALTPSAVLILRVASVVQRLQLLWLAGLCFAWLRRGGANTSGRHGGRYREREDAASSTATVDAWRRSHPHHF